MTDPKIQFALVVEFLCASAVLVDGAGPLDQDGYCVYCWAATKGRWESGLSATGQLEPHLPSCAWAVWVAKLQAVRSILPRGEFF